MMVKYIAAILAAAVLVGASGNVGSFYFSRAQDQITTEGPEITLRGDFI
jgi:hypothetical protein